MYRKSPETRETQWKCHPQYLYTTSIITFRVAANLCERGSDTALCGSLLLLVRHSVAVRLVKNPLWTTGSKGFKVLKLSKADP